MKSLYSFILLSFFVLLTGCEENIDLVIPTAPEEMVAEGYIENGKHPYVMVTRSAPFLGYLDLSDTLALLEKYIVKDAIVTVSDGTTTDTLKFGFDPTLFSLAFGYKSTKVTGQENTYYNLRIEAEGKVITAVTKLPSVVKLDSTWFKVDGKRDTLGFAWAHLTDPDTLGNNYRWFAKRLHKDADFIAPQGSVFEDKFINGKSFDFAYNRGHRPNSTAKDDDPDSGERGFFKKGDTIAVRFCSIDRAHFEFWRTEETQVNSNGNPFASPAPIKSNINGGLGVWGAYAAFYDTIIAK